MLSRGRMLSTHISKCHATQRFRPHSFRRFRNVASVSAFGNTIYPFHAPNRHVNASHEMGVDESKENDAVFVSTQLYNLFTSSIAMDDERVLYLLSMDNQVILTRTLDAHLRELVELNGVRVSPEIQDMTWFENALYLTESQKHRILKIELSTGNVTVFAGTGEIGYKNGHASEACFYSPWGIAVDRSTGTFYVSDTKNHVIRRISPSQEVDTFVGSRIPIHQDGIGTESGFIHPEGILVGLNGMYVSQPHCIRKIDIPSREVQTVAGTNGFSGFQDTHGLDFMSGTNGCAHSGDSGDSDTPSSALFNSPQDMAVDRNQNLFICDVKNNRIRMLGNDGKVMTIAGTGEQILEDGFVGGFEELQNLVVADDQVLYALDKGKLRQIEMQALPVPENSEMKNEKKGWTSWF